MTGRTVDFRRGAARDAGRIFPPVSTHIRDQLQRTLGASYTLDRELGGGGMSRVFVAREVALDRSVVVKVLPPELAGGVNVDRFKREILLAAKLQHPHIVPLLSAGETEGVPYFTMPLVEGESLRARLVREGALPVRDALKWLRDVAAALGCAHERGIVHRDIKPDNVLLSGGSAMVTDFGVAKALRESVGTETASGLTGMGMALGTPAYMAPEQAAADPGVDHRADIYAFGILAYELLTAAPPFVGRPTQEILMAHLTEAPKPVGKVRDDLPPGLARLVMRCLAKKPEDRPQHAREIVAELEAIATSSGTSSAAILATPVPAGPAIGVFLLLGVVLLILAKAASIALGLPDWIVGAAGVVTAVGALALLVLARAARGDASRRLRWRTVFGLGAASLGLLVLLGGGWGALRAAGIGPAGSLRGAGLIAQNDRVVVSDFRVAGADSSVAYAVAEAFRTDLGQSSAIGLVPVNEVQRTLTLMQRPPGGRVDLALARDIAQRVGAKAIVDGEVTALGGGFLITARLVDAAGGDPLASYRESANDADGIIAAVDRLSKNLRAKIGESLRDLRDMPPLEAVSTSSLEALRLYAQGVRAADYDADYRRAQGFLEEAVKADTTFAMAYRKLGVVLGNTGIDPFRAAEMARRAYAFRERLTPLERALTEGSYHTSPLVDDRPRAAEAYERALALDPENRVALNNLALLRLQAGEYARAESLYVRLISIDSLRPTSWMSLASTQVSRGRMAEARRTLSEALRRFPGTPQAVQASILLDAATGRHVEAERAVVAATASMRDPAQRVGLTMVHAHLRALRGDLAGAERAFADGTSQLRALGSPNAAWTEAQARAVATTWFFERPDSGARILDDAMAQLPFATRPVAERPYLTYAFTYALAGKTAKARALVREFDLAVKDSALRRANLSSRDLALGEIALAERDGREAVNAFTRALDAEPTSLGLQARLGAAYDLLGQADSAIAVYERYRTTPSLSRIYSDAIYLPGVQMRLGELYTARGDRARALAAYEVVPQLWRTPDPVLRPKLEDVKRRIESLRASGG